MALHPKPPLRPGAPPAPEPAEDKGRHATDELARACGALETEVEELKVKYEMYFLGVERSEPNRTRDELKKKVLRLKERFTRNAGIRFRIQALHARFLSYERLWLRSAREKEAGTYRRDVLKARKKAAERGPAPESIPASGPTALPEAPAAAPAAAAPVPAPARPPPLPIQRAPAAAMSDAELRVLYESFLAAKRSCNEDVSKVTFESLSRTVNKQAPEIAAKFKASRVEFKVAGRDGRAVLTAVPKA